MSTRLASIDLDAIRHNVRVLRDRVGAPAMAVVKADGYGHGAVPVARAALEGGAISLGVVDIDEALALREGGIRADVLAWLHGADADFDLAVEHGIELGVNSLAQLERAAAAGATVHIKTDTGLSRNGVAPEHCASVFEAAARFERVGRIRVRGVFSHLANAGEAADAAQVAEFRRQLELARDAGLEPEFAHLAATAGALSAPDARFDLVRLGIGIYGVTPFDEGSGAELGLRPAMRLSAEIVAVRRVDEGAGVSYGHRYRTARATTLALVGIGYADGVPRHASDVGPVLINGVRHRASGRIAMDQFVVDVGDHPVAVGDRAVLFGGDEPGAPSAEEWALAADTIPYEIVARVGPRVERRWSE